MGQRIGEDRIATATHLTGVITLPVSLLTLGGRQYVTASLTRTISADVALATNTLYFVYAQIVAGVPALRVSLSAPSTYTVANPTAKLVAAFVSSSAPAAFASFLPIIGLPILNGSYCSNSNVTINTSVVGFTDMQGIVNDSFGLITQNAGAYNSASGAFATTNPKVTNPLPGAKVRILAQIGWVPGNANVAGNWDITIRRNAGIVRSVGKNGQAANTGGLNFMTHRIAWLGAAQAAGDFYDILADNNNGNVPTGLDYFDVEIIGSTQLKDM